MSQNRICVPTMRGHFAPGRVALLASVASIGIAAMLAAPGDAGLPAWTSSAQAAETTLQAPGFADLAAKVKPLGEDSRHMSRPDSRGRR